MSLLHHPRRADLTLAGVLYALGDPTRLAIVRHLAAHPSAPCVAACQEPIARSSLAHHFRVLREAGLVRSRKHGREYDNLLRREDLDARFPGLLDAVLKVDEADAGSGDGF